MPFSTGRGLLWTIWRRFLCNKRGIQKVSGRKMMEANQNSLPEEWIEIADLEVKSKIGVPDEERLAFQRLLVSLRFQIGRGFEELKDQFAATIDYGAVAAETE